MTTHQIPTLEEVKTAISKTNDEIRNANDVLNRLLEERRQLLVLQVKVQFGVEKGSQVICRLRGKDTVCLVDSIQTDHWYGDKPWMWVKPATKSGKWSDKLQHSYTDWRLAEEHEKR